ncbi:helix-turn-helix domain-containing protein [Paenibacillus sp. GSMTC-2017]|uniref:RodZ domain-containing protein n=1 Tax=Paenibacillus sp. GSMTC-2017 TaxID=2794350 RepID=UPI0018D82201|nr:RodZ domain-containing protein [Paenibacillus sp. GSMTC-2017]MBH5316571.1 helix-turn-helix domain-containing protein [Paenibacillus sp. GSMTC-2017]
MSDLGALLRKAREQRGLSLDDLQEVTKIRKRYLEAIETGNYSVLPGNFYVRAFVKNYSEAVGLDPDEVLRLYQHEVPASPVEQTVEQVPVRKPRRMKSQSSERFGKIGFNLLMWCFLILIVFVVWYYAFSKDSGETNKADETSITDESKKPESTNNNTGGEVSPTPSPTPPTPTQEPTTVTFSSKVGRADKYDIGPAGGIHKVEIKVSGGRGWVEVREGSSTGKKLYYDTVEDGVTLSYDLTQPIYINVGRSDFAEIVVNGVLVPDGDRSGPKRLLLSPLQSETDDAIESSNPNANEELSQTPDPNEEQTQSQ